MRFFAKVFLVVGLGASVFSSIAFATDYTVNMTSMYFEPASLTIAPGDRVRWQNTFNTQHTATSGTDCTPDGTWNTGVLNPFVTSTYFTFNTAGTFPYYCRFHCEMGMTGEIIVNAPVRVVPKTWGSIKALYAALTVR